MADPVSWLQIGQGSNVITSDGVNVGTVSPVEGDKQSDIFDGLAVESKQPTQVRYVPGEQVAAIYPGEVTLKIASADIGTLEPFQAPPHEVASGKGASRDSDGRTGYGESARAIFGATSITEPESTASSFGAGSRISLMRTG
jgi:hypothetical protein